MNQINKFSHDYHRAVDVRSLQKSFAYHLKYTLGKDQFNTTHHDRFMALALTIRDRLMERWMETQEVYHRHRVRQVYYLSMEYLPGRLLGNNILNLGIWDECQKALEGLGISLDQIVKEEVDFGLGNGGLGRLAACFMDSLSTLFLPAMGYGLRYEYGIFRQKIVKGRQQEEPDQWLRYGNAWEVERPESCCPVHFGGTVEELTIDNKFSAKWIPTSTVLAMPYDVPISGFESDNVNTLRLWSAQSSEEFDFEDFSQGDYIEAVRSKIDAETLTKVLYPNDQNYSGRELRFRQQYFFVCASLWDILRRHRRRGGNVDNLADKVAIQLNDTHPAMAVAELMHHLVDRQELPWRRAWDITTKVFGYTNHTLLPEALEKWPVEFFQKLLPRHLQIIYEINRRFLEEVSYNFPGDNEKLKELSLIKEGAKPEVRMAYLASVGSHSINGVSKLHTDLLQEKVLGPISDIYSERFNAKTNGVTPRRWILKANPELSEWITSKIGSTWKTRLDHLKKLEEYAGDSEALARIAEIKVKHKRALADLIYEDHEIKVDPQSIFDVHIKRIHEYKRQLMNILHIIILYNRLKDNPDLDIHPRTFIFSGKAAPGYYMAKLIIKFIHSVARVINRDKKIKDKLKVVFLPNYRVSLAEKIIPATEVSEQISTAGTEASGTGNMKLGLNGALTIGTLDGANVEMKQEVGEENIFIFGHTSEEIKKMKEENSYNPRRYYEEDEEIRRALDLIESNFFSITDPNLFEPILYELLKGGDRFFVLADLRAYADCQEKVDSLYRDKEEWNRRAFYNIARLGKFSSDRTIREYADEIWKIDPCPVDMKKKKSHTIIRAKARPSEKQSPPSSQEEGEK